MYSREAIVEHIAGAVIGHHIKGEDEDSEDRKLKNPGDFAYHRAAGGNVIGIIFLCPCGCDNVKMGSFGPRHGRTPVWTWNGNLEKPILTPHLRCAKSGWRSNLVNGVFIPCLS